MRVSMIRMAASALSAFLLLAVVAPVTASAATATKVKNGDEAWFLARREPLAELPGGDPGCDKPLGCNASGNAMRPNPHPEGVLVVAANAGDPDAQMFVNFDLFGGLPAGAIVTGGTMTLPVAQDPDSRKFRPESAKMIACLVDNDFIPGGTDAGSYKDRPDVNDKVCEPVKQTKEDPLTFTVDLERFGKLWGSGTPMSGITLMVDPKKVTPGNPDDTWRVVFNSRRRAENPPPDTKEQFEFPAITSTLEYRVEKLSIPPIGGGGGGEPIDLGGGGGGSVGGGGGGSSGNPFPSSDPGTSGSPSLSGGSTAPSTGGGGFDAGSTSAAPPAAAPADSGTIAAPQDSGAAPVDTPVAAPEPAPAAAEQQPVAAPATQPVSAPGMHPGVWILPLLAVAMAGAMAWSLMSPAELVADREGAVSKLMRTRRLQAQASTPS